MKTSDHKFMKTNYPKPANTQPLSFKRILELTNLDESVQHITDHVIDSVLRFLEQDEDVALSGEFKLTSDSDMFEFLSSHAV